MSTNDIGMNASGAEAPDRVEVCVPVTEGRYYAFSVSALDPETPDQASAVAQLRFLNAAGQQLRGPYPGASTSEKLGPYIGFPVAPGGGEAWSRSIVRAPKDACQVLIRARKWKGSDGFAFTAEPRCVEEIDSARDVRRIQVSPGSTFRLRLRLTDEISAADAAVVQAVYLDGNGEVIEGEHPGLTHSQRFTNYFYAAAAERGADTEVELLSPDNAVELRLHMHVWKASPALTVVGDPAVLSALPPGLDENQWIAVVQDVTLPVKLENAVHGRTGLPQVIRFRTFSDGSTEDIVGYFDIEFPDSEAKSGVTAGPFPLRGSSGQALEKVHAVIPPVDTDRALIRFRGRDNRMLVVSRDVTGETLDVARSTHAETLPGEGRLEIRSAASEAWELTVHLQLLRPAGTGGDLPEFGFFFGDSQKKTLVPGKILAGDYASVRVAGNVTYLMPRRLPVGIAGMEMLSLSARILPPPGAHELIARMHPDAGTACVAAQWELDPFAAMVQGAVAPELSAHLAGLVQHSPDAVKVLLDELMERYPGDPAVVSGGIDACRRLGDIGRLRRLNAVASGLPGAPNARLRLKARLANAVLEEVDTHYLPSSGFVTPPAPRNWKEGGGIRVAHLFKTTVPYENTGGAIRCKNIVRFQKEAGLDPVVITPLGYPHAGTTGDAWETEVVEGITYFRLNPMSREDLREVPVTKQLDFTALLTTRVLQRHPVDIIQASSGYRGYEQALVGLSAARAMDVPFVYEVRSYHEHCWRGMTDWVLDAELTKARFAQEDRCMKEADAVVTICDTMKAGLIERGIDPDKIFVVPNSIDPSAFSPSPIDPEFKRSLGLTEPVTAGYISNVSAREGHHVLLRAVAHARSQGGRLDCLIVGDGPELEGLKALAGELGIERHVVFTGEVPHDAIARYYNAIDIFAIPRIADFASDFVTPMKPFEAMAMRRPLIVSDRPALQEIVGAGKRGMVFQSGNHLDLARCLGELERFPEKRKALVEEAESWIQESRRWDKTILVYQKVYEFAMESAGRRRSGTMQ